MPSSACLVPKIFRTEGACVTTAFVQRGRYNQQKLKVPRSHFKTFSLIFNNKLVYIYRSVVYKKRIIVVWYRISIRTHTKQTIKLSEKCCETIKSNNCFLMIKYQKEKPDFSLICCDVIRVKQRSDTDRRSPEGERRSPSEDEADEKVSSAEIHNAEDYKEIFQPKNAICR